MLPWVNYTNDTCRLFLYQKLRQFLALFAVWLIHFVWEEFVLTPTALYIAHLLKLYCHPVSLGELCK